MKGSVEERFWAKVDKSGDCWLWTASLCNGYFDSLEAAEMAVKAARQRIFTHADNHGVEVPA